MHRGGGWRAEKRMVSPGGRGRDKHALGWRDSACEETDIRDPKRNEDRTEELETLRDGQKKLWSHRRGRQEITVSRQL